jgi:hypothetical protein
VVETFEKSNTILTTTNFFSEQDVINFALPWFRAAVVSGKRNRKQWQRFLISGKPKILFEGHVFGN